MNNESNQHEFVPAALLEHAALLPGLRRRGKKTALSDPPVRIACTDQVRTCETRKSYEQTRPWDLPPQGGEPQ